MHAKPAFSQSLHQTRRAARVAHSAVWDYWRHAMHFVISERLGIPGMTFVHFRFPGMKKTGP